MGWQRYPSFLTRFDTEYPYRPFKINERCFIRRDHSCGKMFGASKACFVASPSEEELEPLFQIIIEKLSRMGIETIIAIKERAYGQDIFCTKICGKIIESKFCLVILNDAIDGGVNIPNPNVYYEYGLMTSIRKHVIPLQKEELDLAFNIQSYDTIKYSNRNIGDELERAFKDAIRMTEPREDIGKPQLTSERTILRNFELNGFKEKGERWYMNDVIEDTGFKGLAGPDGFYLFLGKVDNQNEMPAYIEDFRVVLYRTEEKVSDLESKIDKLKEDSKKYEALIESDTPRTRVELRRRSREARLKELADEVRTKERWVECLSKLYIAFMINPEIEAAEFIKRAQEIVSEYPRFILVINENNEIEFDGLRVCLSVESL